MIKKLLERFGKHNSNLHELRFLITCLSGFVALLQVKNCIPYIQIKETRAVIAVIKLKKSQHKKMTFDFFARIESECCQIEHLENYLRKVGLTS